MSTFKNIYEVGDHVATALGTGVIVKTVARTENAIEHVMVQLSASARQEYNLENRPYKMGYSEILRHI